MSESEVRDILKNYGLKVTPIRTQVLQVLINSEVALSHSDISSALSDESIDKVTLYRTLNIFNEKGIIHKVATEDRNWLYAILLEPNKIPHNEHDHAHFVCDTCDKIFCFPITPDPIQNMKIVKEGFLVKEKEIRLHGLCPTCQ